MSDDARWARLSLADQLRLTAFEAGLARFPPGMIALLYEAAFQLEHRDGDTLRRSSQATTCNQGHLPSSVS
jgi:hypothetical protein